MPTDERYREVMPPPRLLQHTATGRAAICRAEWGRAEKALLAALQLDPRKHVNMFLLSQVYRATGKTREEEALRWELLKTTGRMAEYFELARLFRLMGEDARVGEVLDMAVADIPSLKVNYQRLYEVAERNGIRLYIMQYPGFPVDAMRAYAPPGPNVSYIDNMHLFDADPDRYFFQPTYPQSFTHYTNDGAQVLAQHVAQILLQDACS